MQAVVGAILIMGSSESPWRDGLDACSAPASPPSGSHKSYPTKSRR